DGKYPKEGGPELGLKVGQLQIIAIRKGDTKTAAKYAEFLYRESADNQEDRIYQVGALGCINIELGNYERGFQLLEGSLDELEAKGRADAPACVTSLLGLLQGTVDLERFSEADKHLSRLKKTIELSHSSVGNNSTDRWVKQEASNKSIENAFYVYYSAKLKHAKDDPAAELELMEAFEIVKDPGVRARVTLLYPEMLVYHVQVMLQKNKFEKAEKLADQAVVYYEKKTQNRGNDYIRAKRIQAFARFKNGADTLDELTGYQEALKEHLFEPHPIIATGHVQIAEVLAKQGHFEKAREHLQEALKIRQRLFPENSPGICEAEKLLASLPAVGAAVSLDDIA
ncbi:MAG: tetratricopeptide repeat protein, partial [Candidatus Melainabacteria bacterium]|nr:tetratricopeptide repeat protein [Candidatus Melainabacteria bacterium]